MTENTWLKQERIRAEKEKKATAIRQRELFAESQKAFKEREKQKHEKKKAAITKSKAQKKAKKATKKKAPKKNGVKKIQKARKITKSVLSIFR